MSTSTIKAADLNEQDLTGTTVDASRLFGGPVISLSHNGTHYVISPIPEAWAERWTGWDSSKRLSELQNTSGIQFSAFDPDGGVSRAPSLGPYRCYAMG